MQSTKSTKGGHRSPFFASQANGIGYDMSIVTSQAELRVLYGEAKPMAVQKELTALDDYCRRFISLSPFVVLATRGADGLLDCSPRGDAPGFVRVESDQSVLIPDRRGNNRIDSLSNIIANPEVSLLSYCPV